MKITKPIIIVFILVATLGYTLYTYWPMFLPYLPKSQTAREREMKTTTTLLANVIMAKTKTEEIKITEGTVQTLEATETKKEIKLADPFALRVAVKRKNEELPAPGGVEEVIKPAEPKLEGVWVDAEMKVAFISGQALPIGGTIMGWKVTSIAKERIILQKGSVTKILRLEEK